MTLVFIKISANSIGASRRFIAIAIDRGEPTIFLNCEIDRIFSRSKLSSNPVKDN